MPGWAIYVFWGVILAIVVGGIASFVAQAVHDSRVRRRGGGMPRPVMVAEGEEDDDG